MCDLLVFMAPQPIPEGFCPQNLPGIPKKLSKIRGEIGASNPCDAICKSGTSSPSHELSAFLSFHPQVNKLFWLQRCMDYCRSSSSLGENAKEMVMSMCFFEGMCHLVWVWAYIMLSLL